MKLSFSGFENVLEITPGRVSVLQIESVSLFARVCQSLICLKENEAPEPFSLWDDDGKELSSKKSFLSIVDPFNLPWRDRGLLSALFEQIDERMREDEIIRRQIEATHQQFEHLVNNLSLRLNANYSFGLEWDMTQSLKAYSFGIDRSDSISLFDNLIRFIEFVHDICYKKVLLFVNLEKFLTKNELLELESQLFFHNLSALFLVQGSKEIPFLNSKKLLIDQEFFEFLS